jgi:hypothetical protein
MSDSIQYTRALKHILTQSSTVDPSQVYPEWIRRIAGMDGQVARLLMAAHELDVAQSVSLQEHLDERLPCDLYGIECHGEKSATATDDDGHSVEVRTCETVTVKWLYNSRTRPVAGWSRLSLELTDKEQDDIFGAIFRAYFADGTPECAADFFCIYATHASTSIDPLPSPDMWVFTFTLDVVIETTD